MAGTGNTSIRSYNFFLDTTMVGTTFAVNEHDFVDAGDGTIFLSNTLQFLNDSASDLFFSFDGTNVHGRVIANETITQDHRRMRKIWFRGTAGSAFRFWAY